MFYNIFDMNNVFCFALFIFVNDPCTFLKHATCNYILGNIYALEHLYIDR